MNKKSFKQKIAVIMAIVLTFSVFLPPEAVQAMTSDAKDMISDISSTQYLQNGISIESKNAFGNLLGKELKEKTAEQTENEGNNIFSVEMDRQTANVSFETTEDATLVVCIYSEDGEEMLASATSDVETGQTEAKIYIEENLPEYFYLRSFLVNSETLRPLCTSYETPNYTKEMQEFLAKTTDDFEQEKILNLDEDKTNNFAVYSDETKIIKQTKSANQVVEADYENDKYVINNANKEITSLKQGDIFSYQYDDGEVLIVKIASIKLDGSTVSITGEDTSMEEAFDYVKINSDIETSEAVVDMSKAAEGVEYKGLVEYKEDDMAQRQLKKGVDIDGSTSKALSYQLTDVKLFGSDNVKFSGNVEAGCEFSVKLYLSFTYNYLEVKADYSVKVNGSLSAKVPFCKLPLGYIGFDPFPGVQIGIMPCFVIESNGKININGTLKGTVGIAVSNDENMKSLSSAPKFTTEIKGEITAFIGIDLSPELSILHKKAASVTLGATIGAEIKAAFNFFPGASSSKVHACKKCIDGEITGKADAKYEVSLLNSDKLKRERSENISVKICDFYYSFDFNEFAFKSCPHYKFKIDITVIDDKKNPIAGANIKAPFSINKNDQNQTVENSGDFVETDYITTDRTGKTIGYLPEGAYLLNVSAKDYIATSKGITVTDEAKNIRIVLKKISPSPSPTEQPSVAPSEEPTSSPTKQPTSSPSDDPGSISASDIVSIELGGEHSGAITKDGSLYMWGKNDDNQLGDGSLISNKRPKKILENVSTINLGGEHSGAVTKDGSLYMWGRNDYGQLGDGTEEYTDKPVKVLENVDEISFGYEHSGAITKDGSLYMWGDNVYGQLGYGTLAFHKTRPVKILENIDKVSLGCDYSGAITKDGSLYMWGCNGSGRLGDGTVRDKTEPVKVLENVYEISLGYKHSGAITKDGSLYMWGNNYDGQLGNGTKENNLKPEKVLDNVAYISLGENHSGAITKDGSLYMWGDNYYGQLGDGTTTDRIKPIKILNNIAYISLGENHSGAITKDGSLYMWGYNHHGQLGDGTKVNKTTPVKVFDNITTITSYRNLSITNNSQPVQLKNSTINNMYISVNVDKPLKGTAIQLKSFTGLLPNVAYNFYILKSRSVENLLSPDNLLYIKQYVSDSIGTINVTYQLNETSGYDESFVIGMLRPDLSDAQVEISDLIYNGSEQYIYPKVYYKGNELSEGEDYIVSGDFNVTETGDYSVTISGIGLYKGEITKSFKVKNMGTSIPDISSSPSTKPSGTASGSGGSGGALTTPTSMPIVTLTPSPSPTHVTIATIEPTPKPSASTKPGTGSDSIFNNNSKREITPADVTLNKKTIIYSGKEKKPGVTVLSGSLELIKDKEYTVSYSYNINVGTAYVTVYGKGDYYGSVTKSFKIIPKGTPLKGQIKPRHKGFSVEWKKQPKSITGYQVQYSTDKKFKGKTTVIRTVKKKSVTKLTISKLKAKKKYYVRVRTYKTVKGKKYYSRWSKSKVVKTKK